MYSITIPYAPGDYERIISDLWENGTTGIIEADGELKAFFPDDADLHALATRYSATPQFVEPVPIYPIAELNDEPVQLGAKFLVTHSEESVDVEEGRHLLRLKTSQAFGSGRHETTQLVVAALEECQLEGKWVAEVGCGSGVVAEAARLLGARGVVACDIDPGSVEVARAQFPDIYYFQGSVDAIDSASMDIVVANISARAADALSGELVRILGPEGILLLSGFMAQNPPLAFIPERVTQHNEWQCWWCRRSGYKGGSVQKSVQPFDSQWW